MFRHYISCHYRLFKITFTNLSKSTCAIQNKQSQSSTIEQEKKCAHNLAPNDSCIIWLIPKNKISNKQLSDAPTQIATFDLICHNKTKTASITITSETHPNHAKDNTLKGNTSKNSGLEIKYNVTQLPIPFAPFTHNQAGHITVNMLDSNKDKMTKEQITNLLFQQ